jgi:hypothetical protein
MLRLGMQWLNRRLQGVLPVIRFCVSHAALPVLVPAALLHGEPLMAVFAVICSLALTKLARTGMLVALRARGIEHASRLIERDPRTRVCAPADYFPHGLPDKLWDHPSFGRIPAYIIASIPSSSLPFAVPFEEPATLIVACWPPEKMSPYRNFALLHEMGHAGAFNHEGQLGPAKAWIAALIAGALIGTFASTSYPLVVIPVLLVAAYAALFSAADTRLEAEVWADHFQIRAIYLLQDSPYLRPHGVTGPMAASDNPLAGNKLVPGGNGNTSAPWLGNTRREVFEMMRQDACLHRLGPPERYIQVPRSAYHLFVEALIGFGFVLLLALLGTMLVEHMVWRWPVAFGLLLLLAFYWLTAVCVEGHHKTRVMELLYDMDPPGAERVLAELNRWVDTQGPWSSRFLRWLTTRGKQA